MPRSSSFPRRPQRSSQKKITIKPFVKPPALPDNYYEETSQLLLKATRNIIQNDSDKDPIQQNQNNTNHQTCYTSVVNLVSHQYGPRLYRDLMEEMKGVCEVILDAHLQNTDILLVIEKKYQQYIDYVLVCRHVFLPLDQTLLYLQDANMAVKRSTCNKGSSLWEVGLAQFLARLQQLGLDRLVGKAFWHALCQDYNQNSEIPLVVLAKTIQMYQDLGVLGNVLQELQTQLENMLTRESLQWKSSTTDYKAKAFLQHVHQRWMHVSQQWTFLPRAWTRALIETKLLEPHLNAEWLLSTTNTQALLFTPKLMQVIWMLAGRLREKQRVVQAICLFAKQEGLQCVGKNTEKKTMITNLLQLQSTLNNLTRKTLANCTELTNPLKQVWDEVLNEHSGIAEALAKHVDQQFKSSKCQDYERYSQSILQLFCHLQAKDVFEAFYKRDLAKRLLLSKVVSMDVERNMVTLLKVECGAGYTSKMEGMFQDVEWSRETMARYKAAQLQNSQVDMEVQVLTTGYWPVYPQHPNLILPKELKASQDRFHEHYKTKYQGRRMSWQYALGNCVLKANFPKRKYDLVVSLCQALVLLCFNERDRWTLPEIMAKTGLEDRDNAERLLQSLSLGKEGTRVLRKQDFVAEGELKTKKIRQAVSDKDTFVFHEGFESHMRRIKINNIQWKETKEEREKTVEGVARDRLYLIDAVLVRIMKARKTILHQQLIPQVLEQVKVPAQPSDVKKRIESLIEREYMERDEKDRNRYNYLA